jgi:hypothetical protein
MKKIVLVMAVAFILGASNLVKAEAMDTILLYIPNRIVDFADVVSGTLGFGPAIGAEAQVTQWLAMGGDAGPTVQMVKGINRQYGFTKESGWNSSFLMVSAERKERDGSVGSVKDYYYYSTGVPYFDKVPYDFHNGAKDFWAIGAQFKALVDIGIYVHPVELVDAVLGIFFIDIKGDDFTADDVKQ